jgi:hypothetical protein
MSHLPSFTKILYNSGMDRQVLADQNKKALTASVLSQFRKPYELSKITLILLVLAHTRMRPGFTTHEPVQAKVPDTNRPKRIKSKKGIAVKRPRSRFL